MREADVVIVGAGASGLIIAKKISEAGRSVIILEGRDRLGGRIHTIKEPAWKMPVEAGAEFIHGDMPVTLNLLKEAGIAYRLSGGDSWRFVNGQLTRDDDFMSEDEGGILMNKLRDLKEDITVAAFLEAHFSGEEHTALKQTIKGFVEGFDAADINRASAFTLREEWQEISDGNQYRVDGGYMQMIRFLENECTKNGCFISLSSIAKKINWKPGSVEITTDNHQRYTAKKIIVTVPLGVLCSDNQASASISFFPSLADKEISLKALGYGGVIKILLLFHHAFWKNRPLAGDNKLENMGWLFSGEQIPTWWSQAPDETALLTGWLAGPRAQLFRDADNSEILHEAMESLSKIFKISRLELEEMLASSRIENWLTDPFSLGAYSYATPETPEAAKRVSMPVENTIFFAGEALYDGPEIGTVEAALANGLKVAKMVLENS